MSSTQTPQGFPSNDAPSQSIRSIAQPSASSRKYPSYRRTPVSRRIEAAERVHPRTPGNEENDHGEDPPSFDGLISTTWHTYKITPLYSFKAEVSYLKKYGRLLAAFIEAERRKGDAVDVEGGTADKVEMSFYHGLRVTRDDPVALQILLGVQDNNNGSGKVKTVLTAYLMGVEMEEKLDPYLQGAFVHYPLALVRGPVALTRFLFDWLRSQFDCSVSRLTFSSLDLSWILAMWCGKRKGASSKPVELVYALPAGCEGIDKITMTIDPEDCRGVWDCIHDSRHQDVTTEEVAALTSCLENHFYHHFKIRLTAMQLSSVGTALAFIGSEGKVKMFSSNNALLILRHMTCLAMEQLGSYQP